MILGSHWAPPTLTSHPSRRVLETSQLQAGVCRLLSWSPEAGTHTQRKAHSRLVVPEEGAHSRGFWPHSLAWGAGDSYESSRLPTRLQRASLQSPSLQSEEGDLPGPNATGPDPVLTLWPVMPDVLEGLLGLKVTVLKGRWGCTEAVLSSLTGGTKLAGQWGLSRAVGP